MKIVSIGELLWDVFDTRERLGGAPFHFAVQAHRLGHQIAFLSAVGDDELGRLARERMRKLGLSTEFVRVVNAPTGTVTVTIDSAGEPVYVIHRPSAYDAVEFREPGFQPDWIYFGTLLQMAPHAREVTQKLMSCSPAKRFYDVNLREGNFTPHLVLSLLAQSDAVKMNEPEAFAVAGMLGWGAHSHEEFTRRAAEQFEWRAVCITCGARGCFLRVGQECVDAPGYPVDAADTVGAGDAFAAAFLHGLESGWPLDQIADFANRKGAFVAAGGIGDNRT